MLVSKEDLKSLQVSNAQLCKEVKTLKHILLGRCHVIGATRPDHSLQVKISNVHLGERPFSTVGAGGQGFNVLSREQIMGMCPVSEHEIPDILPFSSGRSLWIVKSKLSRDMLNNNPRLKDLVGFNPLSPEVKISLYCLVDPEYCNDFFRIVVDNSRCFGYVAIPNFLHIVDLVYVRVRGFLQDKKFSELFALKDVAGLLGDFFVKDDGHSTADTTRWTMVRSVSRYGGSGIPFASDLSVFGAEGGVSASEELPLIAEGGVSRSRGEDNKQKVGAVLDELKSLACCLERKIARDQFLS
ncbi:DUF3023 domain-containing protein [Ehrlichia muris]|uniref:Uncharacterized protein n=1 Tax=Ehrlichia muris AS145 TaxID=1423892 RepID=V9R7A9_9RICK|nr:DUF3023 domain-containing protein [Ehrlichia muris]AHC39702.1 hypothetical protein EMUR_01870 [Ehrlichia muris AS145]